MTRQAAIEELTPKLTALISETIGQWCEDCDMSEFGYFGPELPRMMAKAAMSVLEASADVQDYMRQELQIEDE